MTRQPDILPVSKEEGKELGIDRFDVIIVSGDAPVDHPSFASALLGRALWEKGYPTGIISQPDWTRADDFCGLGTPRLFFAVSAGAVDPMVNHYTPGKKQRSQDVYSPGGERKRPDRATIVYAERLHSLFPGTPVIIGGIEASLRRFAHYDYWSDRVRRSILADAPADLLVYGMGERAVFEIASRLSAGEQVPDMCDIRGTVYRTGARDRGGFPPECVKLPSFSEVSAGNEAFARAYRLIASEQDPVWGRPLLQNHPKTTIIQNPPALPLTTAELDQLYELPFSRREHPSCKKTVPALEPVRFSVVTHRGCFGNCSFCALSHHQGCIIQSRSRASLEREVRMMTGLQGWKGIVQDAGGPTANMYGMYCSRWEHLGTCSDRSCGPDCPNLIRSSEPYRVLLAALREIPGVRRVFVSSGIRYDLFSPDDSEFLEELCTFHISGHFKVAPEHITPGVTARMGKPPRESFDSFRDHFERLQSGRTRRQYLLPYFMSGHPGCTIRDMVELAEYIRDTGLYTEQVQDFTPTPMTASTCMYHTGLDPKNLEPVHTAKGREKKIQRALLHYRDSSNRELVKQGLLAAGRKDLIGNRRNCLIADAGVETRPPGRKRKVSSPDSHR
jgi:uncharacterized radical SAM protein YgiQ